MKYFRNVSVGFWTDSRIEDDFSPEDKYFYLYLLTNPNSNICGCFELSNRQAATETGYNEDTIRVLLDRLSNRLGVIKYSKTTKEVLILNWYKYNWTKSEKLCAAVVNVSRHIKSDEFRNIVLTTMNRFKSSKEESIKEENNNIVTEETVVDEEVEIEKEIDSGLLIDTDSDIEVSVPYQYPIDTVSTSKPVKHKHGDNKNVLLTDEEYQKLQGAFHDYEKRINDLSYYIASYGNKYKNHYMTILNWARKEMQTSNEQKGRNDFIDEL